MRARALVDLSTSRWAGIALVLVLAAPPAQAAGPEGVGCARCIVVDENGAVLWARNPRDRYPNASTTKMVTALLAARGADPSDLVTVSSTAGSVGGGGLDLTAGRAYSVDALMHALLLDSSNEAAYALAEHVAGSADRFVVRMNRYVRSIGATRTHFVNPHGLDAEGHYASAADLATIGAEVLADSYLADIVATRATTIATPTGPVRLENRNVLLETYDGAIGIKTGRTLGAGYVLVAAAVRAGHRLITVAMNSYDVFGDSTAMLDWGFARLRRLERRGPLVEAGDVVGELVFDGGSTSVLADDDVRGIVPVNADLEITFEPSTAATLPIDAGDEVGTVTVAAAGRTIGTISAVAAAPVAAQDRSWWATPVVALVSLVGGIFG